MRKQHPKLARNVQKGTEYGPLSIQPTKCSSAKKRAKSWYSSAFALQCPHKILIAPPFYLSLFSLFAHSVACVCVCVALVTSNSFAWASLPLLMPRVSTTSIPLGFCIYYRAEKLDGRRLACCRSSAAERPLAGCVAPVAGRVKITRVFLFWMKERPVFLFYHPRDSFL